MGSYGGHLIPGTLFLMVGIWHIWCSVMRYASNPKTFRVRVWNPVPGFDGRLKYLELYVIAIGSFIELCIELLYATHLKFFVHGILNPSRMNDFEHAGMLLMFFIFGVVALLSEQSRLVELPEGALCLIAATAFTVEHLLFYFHSTTHKGIEGHYHFILVLLADLCIISMVSGALIPTSFPVEITSAIALTLQGLWFYQTAFALYGSMMPAGCQSQGPNIVCQSSDSEVRGQLLANFQLFTLAFSVLAGVAGLYGFADWRFGSTSHDLVFGSRPADT